MTTTSTTVTGRVVSTSTDHLILRGEDEQFFQVFDFTAAPVRAGQRVSVTGNRARGSGPLPRLFVSPPGLPRGDHEVRLLTYRLPELQTEVASLAEAWEAAATLGEPDREYLMTREDGESTTVKVWPSAMSVALVNATPDLVILMWNSWVLRYLPPSGLVVHAETEHVYPDELIASGVRVPVGHPVDAAVTATRDGRPVPVPYREPFTAYVVTPAVQQACPERLDFFCPGPDVRDEHGQLLGQRGLLQ